MTPATTTKPLLDSDFMRKLEQWSLAIRRTTTGAYGGNRRSKRLGQSTEFADFRHYIPGDDTRLLDWNLYARLEKLFLKLFLHEQDLHVHILVDLSESMTFGSPPKSLLARKLAAALGYLTLVHQDGLSVTIGCHSGAERDRYFPIRHGRAFSNRLMQFMSDAPEGGALDLGEFVNQALVRIRRPGMIILVTDFMDRGGFETPLRAIIARRHEGIILHTLGKEEWEPTVRGDLKLIDSEDGEATEVSVTPGLLRRYRQRVHGWGQSINDFCTRRGLSYLRVFDDAVPEDVILKTLRQMGRLK